MKRIVLDFDNTLVNTTKAFVDSYKLIYGRQYLDPTVYIPQWDKVNKYDFTDEIPTMDSRTKTIIFNSTKFFDLLECYPNAEEVVNELSKEYVVDIVSICSMETIQAKEKFISTHFPNCRFQPVLYPYFSDKSHINMENCVFVDDHAGNLETSNAAVKICFTYQGIRMDVNNNWKSWRADSWGDPIKETLVSLI